MSARKYISKLIVELRIIHFGKNPRKGGSPLRESRLTVKWKFGLEKICVKDIELNKEKFINVNVLRRV